MPIVLGEAEAEGKICHWTLERHLVCWVANFAGYTLIAFSRRLRRQSAEKTNHAVEGHNSCYGK